MNHRHFFDGPNKARVVAHMRAEHWLTDCDGGDRYTMFGYYNNSCIRQADGSWKFDTVKLNVTRFEGNYAVMQAAVRRGKARIKGESPLGAHTRKADTGLSTLVQQLSQINSAEEQQMGLLLDQAELSRLAVDYAAGLDSAAGRTDNWALWKSIFTNPFSFDMRSIGYAKSEGPVDDMVHVVDAQFAGFDKTQHVITNHRHFLDTGGRSARVLAHMRAEHWIDHHTGSPRYTMLGYYVSGLPRHRRIQSFFTHHFLPLVPCRPDHHRTSNSVEWVSGPTGAGAGGSARSSSTRPGPRATRT